jgi:hypothetical protein
MPNTITFISSNLLVSESKENLMCKSIQSAGINTHLVSKNNNNAASFEQEIKASFEQSEALVLVLGNEFTQSEIEYKNSLNSIDIFIFGLAKEHLSKNTNFKILIWDYSEQNIRQSQQLEVIFEIRNSLTKNVSYNNSSTYIEFVEDLRTSLVVEKTPVFDIQNLEVFFISNEIDEIESKEIVDMLSDVLSAHQLQISQNSDIDYSEFCKQQIEQSKLAVVYFKETADWALPFAQQIWKKLGGANSITPILLIGDEEPDSNLNKKFKAPKVISVIIAGILIPLEIKVTYDKALEGVLV